MGTGPRRLPVMSLTTRVISVSVPVRDQDEALASYTGVLGCEVRLDAEAWPGARVVEVVPPGSTVGIVPLPPGSEIPIAVRLAIPDAEAPHARVRGRGRPARREVLRMEGAPAMFSFVDPDGNGLVYWEEPAGEG